MKIYNKIIFNKGLEEIYSESFSYEGELSFCGGGGKSSSAPVQVPEAPTPPAEPEPVPDPVQKASTKSVTEASTAAKEAQQEKAQQAKGIKSTLLSNQESVKAAEANKKTLLG